MQPRTVALIGLLGLGLGWALGGRAPLGRPGEATVAGRGSGGPRPLGVSGTVTYAPPEPLKAPRRVGPAPQPPHAARNPFVFGARPAAVRPAVQSAADETSNAARDAVVEEPPARVALRLTGMATAQGPDGPEFTAMVHDGRSLLFLKRGDAVLDFVVVDIRDTSVTLRDAAGGERTLVLP